MRSRARLMVAAENETPDLLRFSASNAVPNTGPFESAVRRKTSAAATALVPPLPLPPSAKSRMALADPCRLSFQTTRGADIGWRFTTRLTFWISYLNPPVSGPMFDFALTRTQLVGAPASASPSSLTVISTTRATAP